MIAHTFAIMGATGQIGRVLAETLLKQGHDVHVIGRAKSKLAALEAKGATGHAAAFDDANALANAFKGASAVFTMIPPGYDTDDYPGFQNRIGEAIAQAVKQAKLTHVVSLSSLAAQWPSGTGPIAGLHRQEERLKKIPGLNVVHLRPGYFMENQFWAIPVIKQHGVSGSAMRGDKPVLMVATRDIAAKAAEILSDPDFSGSSVVELVAPRGYTLTETTAILGKAIGKPDLKYVQFSEDDTRKAMLGMGMKPHTIEVMLEMDRAFNDGRLVPEGKTVQGPTTLEQFAPVFAKVYQSREPVPA
jgi:uncharacterized protein YbjT (DUF2867 family)